VVKPTIDMEKYESVKKNILERYKDVEEMPMGYTAQAGDIVLVNMKVLYHEALV
jgi:hypothetical protein